MAVKKIGEIVNTYGLKGQLKVSLTTTNPQDRFAPGNIVLIKDKGGRQREYEIEDAFLKNSRICIVALAGYENINDIEWMIGREIFADVEAPEGAFYYDDLIGMDVILPNGIVYGKVSSLEEMPAGLYIVVKDHYVPFDQPRFIESINLEKKEIRITNLAEETLQ